MRPKLLTQFAKANQELWLILSMFIILALINFVISSDRLLLGLYTLPTVFSAYFYGRRHATLTALSAVSLVALMAIVNPSVFSSRIVIHVWAERWFELALWGGTLVVTAYAMGTLYERVKAGLEEMKHTYEGILMILRHFISKDKYTENHCYRVSLYAVKIASCLGLSPRCIEDVRAAALLHDIGKLDISRDILYKAARLTQGEYEEMRHHVNNGARMLEPVGGALRRILPIILAHHDRFDGSGYRPTQGQDIPLEARIIAVADVYDSLTSDRPYRKASPPFEVRALIAQGKGTEFDPKVVDAFLTAFSRAEMEVPDLVV
jgi:putative nucleotidyltransferase with HDIG domain